MISVIIPVYNGEKYIECAIKSILNQSYKEIEVIVIDDGSIDNTAEIVKKYPIKYVYQNNQGEAAARNKGIEIARGKYIGFCDADDMYLETKIEEQVKLLENDSDVDIVYCNADLVDKDLKYITTLRPEYVSENSNNFLAMMIFRQVIPCTPTIMFRKKCIEDIKYSTEYVQATDYDFSIKLAERFKFKHIDKMLYLYRRHSSNATNNQKKQLENEVRIISKLSEEYIHNIIYKTNFDDTEKTLLFSKVMIKIDNINEAIKELNSIKDKKADWRVLFYLANCMYLKDDFKNSIKLYLECIHIYGDIAEVYNNLGCAYEKLDYRSESLECFEKSIEVRQEYMDPKINIKCVLGDYDELKLTKRELRNILTIY